MNPHSPKPTVPYSSHKKSRFHFLNFGYVVHKKDNNGNKEKVIKHLHLFECPDHVLSNETLLKEWLEDVLNVERECQQILMAKFDKIV